MVLGKKTFVPSASSANSIVCDEIRLTATFG
jgi:hypothetical protein